MIKWYCKSNDSVLTFIGFGDSKYVLLQFQYTNASKAGEPNITYGCELVSENVARMMLAQSSAQCNLNTHLMSPMLSAFVQHLFNG